jgi:hypothetical protein
MTTRFRPTATSWWGLRRQAATLPIALAAWLGACKAPTIIDNEPVRPGSTLILHPPTATLAPGQTQQFAAYYDSISADTPAPATYTSTGGTISAVGLFVAGTTPGVYQITAQKDTLTAISTVTVTPPPPLSGAISQRMFGLHVSYLYSQPQTAWPAVTFGTWRLWDTRGVRWFELEPAKDQWEFGLLDLYVDRATQHGLEVMLTLGQTPTWASARPTEASRYSPGAAAEPASMTYWQTYIRTVATRYKGRIKAYELWNEPDGVQYWSGTTEMMVTLAREAYAIIKEVDPAALVITPGETGGPYWLDPYLAAGGGNYADVIAYHMYPPSTESTPENLVSKIASVRTVMNKYGQGSKPLWNTETGWCIANAAGTVTDSICNKILPGRTVQSSQVGAAFVARAYLLAAANGVERFFWYGWDNSVLGLVETDRVALKPAGTAYQEMRNWLVGSRVDSCAADAAGIWICAVTRPDAKIAHIVWRPAGTAQFSLPAAWQPILQRFLNGATSALAPGATAVQIGVAPIYLQP